MPQPSSKKSGSAGKSTQSVRQSVDNETGAEKSDETKSRAQRRQEEFDQRREERRKAPSRQKRERLIVRAVLGGIAVLLIAGVAWEVISYVGSRDERQQPDNVKTYAYAGGDHTYDTVDYAESPPVGGVHDPVWQTCDFYDGVVRNENAVHSLEHGAVWITYRPDISEDELQKLRDIQGGDRFILVSEYDDQESPIVATAWNNQLDIDSADDIELRQFVNYFRQGPQTQEPGATCAGGVTATIG